MPANLENSAVATGLEKVSFHSNSKERQYQSVFNLPHNRTHLTLGIRKVMLKVIQARFQQYVNHELPDVQAGFRKGRGTRDQIVNNHWIIEKAREFQKSIYFCFIDYVKDFDCVDDNKLWKKFQEMGIPDHLTCLLQDLLELTPKKDVLFIIGDWNAKVGSQETPGVTGKLALEYRIKQGKD